MEDRSSLQPGGGMSVEGVPSSILHPPSSIFLVGYRCTGKSTVARLLAERLGWEAVDADDVLEARAGRSIREVFAAEGEAGFREREAAVLAELAGRRGVVIATGGGVVLRDGNRERMRGAGRVVWLAADADTIWRRLQDDPSTPGRRPPLTAGGGRAEIDELLAVREPFYRVCADLIVDTVGRTPEEVAGAIIAALGQKTPPGGR